MGCDIHGWVEGKVRGRWIGVLPLRDRNRDYKRFSELAGVRGEGPPPRGIPEDISDSTRFHIESEGEDGHSHSWLPLQEAFEIFKRNGREHYWMYDMSGLDDHQLKDADEWRLVFWFDN